MVHSSIGMTPVNAVKPENWAKAKDNMLKKANFSRTYKDIKVGDKVQIFKKKQIFKKRMFNDGVRIDLQLKRLKMNHWQVNYITYHHHLINHF